jgi:hypothetical protein
MKTQSIKLLFVFTLVVNFTYSQSYIGNTLDNYSGIHGVINNPSSIVGSPFKSDINILSVSIFGGSDYFGIDIGNIISSNGGFDFDEETEKFPTNENNFFFNTDVLGPSFMMNINKKSSIGLITRARGFFNINHINGELYETVADDFETDSDFAFDSSNLNGTAHVWAEIGLSYGRILLDKTNHVLKGGATLKYLQGAGSVFFGTPGLQGSYDNATENLTTQGVLNYGSTQGFDEDDINFDELSSGIGLDIGFTYQWHPERENDSIRLFRDPYKIKVGISVTDFGSITYNDSEVSIYDLNNSVSTSNYDEDVEEFLDNNYPSTETIQNSKIKLPSALHLMVDYRLTRKFLVSVQANLSLVKQATELSNSVINTFILAPRYETKWFTFYTPVSLRQYGDFAFGGGFRLGPLTLGSGSVFSNLLSNSSKTTDVYVGLKIPIYKK